MVRHIILWKLRSDIPADKLDTVKADIKEHLEALPPVIEGLESLLVHTDGLPSSTCDLMLESVLMDKDALKKGVVRSASPREGAGHHKHSSRVLVKESIPLPAWLPAEARSELWASQWGVLCAEKPPVAKLLRLCSGEGEELDWLGRLLEQLFNGGCAASQ